MEVGKQASRKRAVGTREHIIAYLAQASELFDANGMASAQLAAAVGYPGSSVAFAQLLSGMERSGLIEREVRGKRTYRISLGSAPAASGPVAGARGGALGAPAEAQADFDYDELARRLLVQVVRRLAVTEASAEQADPAACRKPSPGWSRNWPAPGPGTASWPRRTSGYGNSSRSPSSHWRSPASDSSSCPPPPILTAAMSCCCSGCSRLNTAGRSFTGEPTSAAGRVATLTRGGG